MAKKWMAALLAIVMVLTAFPFAATAAGSSESTKPADGTSTNKPFESGNPSQNYRIPGMVTLNDGTIVAVADARWDQQKDGGGNDVITARSTDNGLNWTYTMAGYYGDNGNKFSKASTSYCDTNITTDGTNVYLLSTFFASGVAINNSSANDYPSAGTGMNESGQLVLKKSGEDGYNYHVGDFSNGYAPVLDSSNNSTGYQVNDEYELYQGSTKVGCVWYSDCVFQAYKTQYLFFRKSTDGGKTWSGITLVNVKANDEVFCGAGPGRGIVLDDGTICLPVYRWARGTFGIQSQGTSMIYSHDGGKTWSRTSEIAYGVTTAGASGWSSESQLVDLGNGVIRCFYRNAKDQICYADYTRNGTGFNTGSVVTSGIANCSDCMISAVMYPYKINGKRAILVSCPSDKGRRTTGSIYALLLNSDNTISEYTKKDITASGASFMYSCLTVLPDGRVADLCETGGKDFSYQIFTITGLTGGDVDLPSETEFEMNLGNQKTITFDDDTYTNSNTAAISEVSKKLLSGSTAAHGTDSSYNGNEVSLSRALYKFTNISGTEYRVSHAGMYLSVGTNGKAGYPGASKAANVTVKATENGGFQLLQDGDYALYFHRDGKNRYDRWAFTSDNASTDVSAETTFFLYRRVRDGESPSSELPGYVKVNTIENDEEYLIAQEYNGSYYILYPSTSTTNMYAHCVKATGKSCNDGISVTIQADKLTDEPVILKDTLTTYKISVVNDLKEITGAVTYDPVIYTMGENYMMLGNTIAAGSSSETYAVGEKHTAYKVAEGYTIEKIRVVDGGDEAQSVIQAGTDGLLHGTLVTTNDVTASVTSGTTVTLETVLRDTSGQKWTQTDALYVASNPVAGNLYGNAQSWRGAGSPKYIQAMPLILTANGSYGNTAATFSGAMANYRGNAIDMYTANATTVTDAGNNDGGIKKMFINSSDKIAGRGDQSQTGDWSQKGEKTTTIDNSTIAAYYYYDVSSTKNEGIHTVAGTSGKQFYFYMGLTPVSVGVNSRDNRGQAVRFTDGYNGFELDNGLSVSQSAFTGYNLNSGSVQTLRVDGNLNNTSSTTLNGQLKVYAQTSDNNHGAGLKAVVPFQVIVCDKSVVRTPYNEAVSRIRKSTEYTTSTWNSYKAAMLDAEAYLNDYTNTGDYKPSDTVTSLVGTDGSFEGLTKRVDFTELDKALVNNKSTYDNGFENATEAGQNKYTVSSWCDFENAYKEGTELSNSVAAEDRSNTAGYTVGPDSTEKDLQQKVDEATDGINAGLVEAADASAYESARSLSGTIDRTAYPDSGSAINNTISTGNSTIYKAYNGKDYVNVPAYEQDTVDGYTSNLLSDMNVGENSTSGRTFTVTCAVDGNAFATQEQKTKYNYGTVAHIDLSAYKDSDTVCVVKSGTGIDVTETKIDLAKCNYQLALLVQQDITVTVTTATAPNVIVADYFGTVLGAFVNATSVTVKDNTVTVGDTVITAKDSPKYTFTGWTWGDGTYTVADGQVMQIVQKGTRTGGVATFSIGTGTATNAKVNGEDTFDSTGLNTPLELTSDNAKFWTRTVNGEETLASYEQNLTLFSSNVDSQFKAYTASAELPTDLQDQAMNGTPVAYGVGYFADNKFTLSCDFSAGSNVTVLEVGAVYSTTKSGTDDLVKGGDGTIAVVSRNVAHWTGNQNSGTFTMTKKGSDTGTHYMRAYVSYRVERQGTQVPFVVYGDVYQCVNGTVTAVND